MNQFIELIIFEEKKKKEEIKSSYQSSSPIFSLTKNYWW